MFKVKDKYNIAIVGATGIVGESLLDIISSRKLPIENIIAIASKRSEGNKVKFGNQLLDIIAIDDYDFKDIDIAFFSAGSSVSQQYAPIAANAGAVVIDNTSEFRYVDDIPLVVPEVNPDAINKYKKTNIIANPNCSTIQMLVALKPIHDRYKILSINVCTYQAVSGSGKKGVDELLEQSHSYMNQQEIKSSIYPKQIAFNVIPFVDSFCENGYTKEEMKMVWETQKILDKDIKVNATAVRVPVLIGHSESVTIETESPISIEDIKSDFKNDNGVELIDNPGNDEYPTAFVDGHGTDKVYVGRIRKSLDNDNILNIWIVADNVRKGAALNSVQIAEQLMKGDK
ncbi:MAG: aspartate-semialdehyde dehydrogenase [Gammaproteobacteria bacterium]|nr:aspartate-semialdehyde dehydrogenase [Gammaproteobacteria bacterium]MBT5643589.1 aspartate-semialdehyde dehydrogenase [Gammaproteobacteria bacterium]MBT5863613.1 aspartate-semialdehyde dehydrogenase [Gammaproteobacteria bacterium]MBT7237004.1 aspartate-semialdehyde dehydrogenase [Gammaproteobacteria bacterium]